MNFQFIFNHAPQKIQDMFIELGRLRERPDYHPEESAAKHIEIVTNRCIASNNPNLIMTAFFHDLFKAETARPNPKNGFPTCPGHDAASASFIRRDEDAQAFIRLFRADVETVAWLVSQHMRIAQIDNMRASKQAAFRAEPHFRLLEAFHCCDNMLVSDQEAITQMFNILTA
jgi:hypothetical protein